MAKAYDCIIIGGGVIGLACAERLSRENVNILLLEKGACGRRASWAAAGILSLPDPLRKDTGAHLQRQSVAMFPEFCHRLKEESGIDPEYWPCGSLEVYHEDQQWRMGQSKLFPKQDGARPVSDPDWRILEPPALHDLQPGVSELALGGLLCGGAAQIRPPRLLQALKATCLRRGVQILEGVDVQRINFQNAKVVEIDTTSDRFEAAKVIVCTGTGTSNLDTPFGPLADVRPVRGQLLLLEGAAKLDLSKIVQDRFCYLVPRRDNLVLLGATLEPESGFEERVTKAGMEEMLTAGARLMPSVAELPLLAVWAGLRPSTPDNLPCIGISIHDPRIILATGHYRTGIALAPLTAEAVADLFFTGQTNRLGRLSASVIRPARPPSP